LQGHSIGGTLFLDMKKTVKREYIDEWIKEAYPNGLYKLSEKTKIPVNSLTKIRLGTWIPRNPERLKALADALGVEESVLFPVGAGKGKAS
jgi:hypothetical protein